MSNKRKANGDNDAPSKTKMEIDGEDDSGSEDDIDMLNVDFEWFEPEPSIDFHGIKNLLRQLFDVDNQLIDLSELTDLILAQPQVGSTVKCDGKESDPFAFLTVLNLHQHRDKPVIQQLGKYLLARVASHEGMHARLKAIFAPEPPSQDQAIGLILTERLINMPHQIVPPLYTMLLEEMQQANKENEPYSFSHYLLISKTYTEVTSKLDAEDDRPQKKKKAGGAAAETFYFHPEDEVLRTHVTDSCAYEYEKQGDEGASDAKRAFQEMGIRPQGQLMLIEGKEFEAAVQSVGKYLNSES